MNKADLSTAIAEKTGISIAKAEEIVTTILDSIVSSLSKGDDVSLVGFGNFKVKDRAARKVRNPQTGKEMMVAAKRVASFKAGKKLKEQVADKK